MKFPVLHRKKYASGFQVHVVESGKVFMGYKPDQQVAAKFIEAVKHSPDDAWAFVSKVYSPAGMDLNELKEILDAGAQFVKWGATYINDPKNCLTRSVYVEDPVRNLRRLLHLRMIFEPDHNGPWKICKVEQEECARI